MTDGRKAPPRVRKPSPHNDQCLAPTGDLESHRARLREAFGNTLSDEFVEVLLGELMELLRPNPIDHLQEPTLNAALALIASIQPRSEMEALMAVQNRRNWLVGRALPAPEPALHDFIEVYGVPGESDFETVFRRLRRAGRWTVCQWRRDLQSRRDQLVAVTARYALPLTPTSVAMK